MFPRLRFPPRLRLLLALGLVPVVLLGNPQTAAAANPWHQVEVSPSLPGVPDMDCTLNLQYGPDGQTIAIGSNSACSGSTDITPGTSQWGEEGSGWAISVSGTQASGASCGGNGSGTFGSHSSSGVFNVAGSFGAGTIALGSTPTGCEVTEVCLFLFPDGAMNSTEDCVPVDMGTPILEGQQCEYGDVLGVELQSVTRARAGSPGVWEYFWEIHVYLTDASRYDLWRVTRQEGFTSDFSKVGVSAGGDKLVFPQTIYATTIQGDVPQLLQDRKPLGVEVYALDQVRNTGSGYDGSSASKPTSFPPNMPDGPYRGLTTPALCRFWAGPKIVDFPNTVEDEPTDPLDELPYVPPDDSTDEPDVDPVVVQPEPVDDEPGFWSLVGGLLRLILGAIKALGTAIGNIVGGLLDGLQALFVPDSGFMDGEFRDLEDQWAQTTPARFVDALEGFQGGAVSGCGGLPLELPLPGGVQVSEKIGAACTGKMAEVAGIVRMVLSAGLVVGGTFACVRAVGSGFGWNPGVGNRVDV